MDEQPKSEETTPPQRSPELQAQTESAFFDQLPDDNPYLPDQPAQPQAAEVPAAPQGIPPTNLDDAIPQEPVGTAAQLASLPDTSGAVQGRTDPQQRVFEREAGKRADRKERLHGGAAPPQRDTSEGTAQGVRSPGFESIQGADDVAGSMVNYQNQLVSTLSTISRVLLEATSKLEQIEAYFDRLR